MSAQEIVSDTNPSTKEDLQKFFWKEYLILAVAGLFGYLIALPTTWSFIKETADKAGIPFQLLVGEQIIQSTIWILLAVGIGLLVSRKTGLGAPILEAYLNGKSVRTELRSRILPSVSLGVLGASAAKILDVWFFIPRMPGFSSVISETSGWKGFLASFYGGITEEILSRLLFLTLLAWVLSWFSHTKDEQPTKTAMWIAILGSAVIFGLGHLPATLMTNPFSLMILARAILLNGILAAIFGYLYWKRGLEYSIMAHFSADLMVHVILPAIMLYL